MKDLDAGYPQQGHTYPFLTGQVGYRADWAPGRTFLSFARALGSAPVDTFPALDEAALLEIATKGYAFHDRTTVRGVTRAPFVDVERGESLPPHSKGEGAPASRISARELWTRLCNELEAALAGRGRIGLLLSGGMDSRVVAGALQQLSEERRASNEIVAITWGTECARDVQYARSIAYELGWEWRYIELGPALLRRNLLLAQGAGAEVSPLHLHGLPDVGAMPDIDMVVAGSYGDSVGRAEFSGRHVSDLKPHDRKVDPYALFPSLAVEGSLRARVTHDARAYRGVAGERREWEYREIEHQGHYMRRLLQTSMLIGLDGKHLYQAFSSPSVYGYMWSLPSACRGDSHYGHILDWMDPALRAVPWTRTGRPYGAPDGEPVDRFSTRPHRYGEWARGLQQEIREAILGGPMFGSRSFRLPVENFLREWMRSQTTSHTRLDSLAIWLAALSEFVAEWEVRPPTLESPTSGAQLRGHRGHLRTILYRHAKDRFG